MAVGGPTGRPAIPAPLRVLPGGNAAKLGAGQPLNPPVLTEENADRMRDLLLVDDLSKQLWDLYVEEGRAAKLLANIDVAMLAALCIEQAVYFHAAQEYGIDAAKGQWHKLVAEKGGAYRGAMAAGNKAFEKVLSLSAQFGMMPSARAKIAAIGNQLDLLEEAEKDVEQAQRHVSAVEGLRKKLNGLAAR